MSGVLLISLISQTSWLSERSLDSGTRWRSYCYGCFGLAVECNHSFCVIFAPFLVPFIRRVGWLILVIMGLLIWNI